MLFERQEYQETCVGNILRVVERAEGQEGPGRVTALKAALDEIHAEQGIPVRTLKDQFRLDVLMETGTGKTFTYLKAMYELNRQHGLNKFVIFVPRLAIRAGIVQNIALTSDYFFQEYGKRLKRHTYGDKQGLSRVRDYIRNEGEFSVLILTSSSVTGGNEQSRVLTRYDESLYGAVSPLKAVQALKPVVVIDEPHLLKGEEFTKVYDKHFAESLLLRFGATFPAEEASELSNVVYTLDSLTAFQEHLVKRISVSTVTDANSSVKFYRSPHRGIPLTVQYFKQDIERTADLKFGQSVAAVTGDKAHDYHVIRVRDGKALCSDGRGRELASDSYEVPEDTMRDMISQTIRIHFEKEEALFQKGIKTLSLFFIPHVEDFRKKDDSRSEPPRVKQIFEEEYLKQRRSKLRGKLSAAYREFLAKDFDDQRVLRVHEGYFSGDRGTLEQKESEGINTILNDKERLLSTEEPLRFIFSVWALQEGWDNPNVFTICKLAAAGKETSRRQQVGRGLRLAVNDRGNRQTIKRWQDRAEGFYGINTLDVVVSGQENQFIENIQKEIVGDSLTTKILTPSALMRLGLDHVQSTRLLLWLVDAGVIQLDQRGGETYQILSPIADYLAQHGADLPPSLQDQHEALVASFQKAVQSPVANRNLQRDKVGVRSGQFKEFEALWEMITSKAQLFYRNVQEDSLVAEIKSAFDGQPIPAVQRRVEKRTYDHHKNQIVVEDQTVIGEPELLGPKAYAQLVADFANRETLPFPFCLKLFSALDREKVAGNPKLACGFIAEAVREQIHKNVVETVEYDFDVKVGVDARNIFYTESGDVKKELDAALLGQHLDKAEAKASYLYDKVAYDSQIELDLAQQDPDKFDGNKVVVFAKLPRISIPTPYKSYSPDFAYYIQTAAKKKLYLVVETKGYDKASDIPEEEARKIRYGERFFEAMQQQVAGKTQIEFKKRINKQELAELVQKVGGKR